jgi:hypothetical protein
VRACCCWQRLSPSILPAQLRSASSACVCTQDLAAIAALPSWARVNTDGLAPGLHPAHPEKGDHGSQALLRALFNASIFPALVDSSLFAHAIGEARWPSCCAPRMLRGETQRSCSGLPIDVDPVGAALMFGSRLVSRAEHKCRTQQGLLQGTLRLACLHDLAGLQRCIIFLLVLLLGLMSGCMGCMQAGVRRRRSASGR